MAKYRKKPVIIEAEQYNGSNNPLRACKIDPATGKSYVETMHDGQIVVLEPGDWVIPDGKPGTFYPCKPDVFANTYELVEDATVSDLPEFY